MSESEMWNAIRPVLKPLDPVRVESPISPGLPDVNYVGGWIELKYVDRWPVRPDTPLKIDHFTKQQRIRHRKRRQAGGKSFVLIKVDKGINAQWLLFDGRVAADNIGTKNKEELCSLCLGRWLRLPRLEELQTWL